jgi:ribosome biogenesis GTPase / thiamine phosphate phosphatase
MISHEDWEHHFDPSRRELRKERKIAKRTDRSKYKISDQQKKVHEQPEKIKTEGLLKGKVVHIRSQDIEVDAGDHTFTCTLRGTFKQDRNLNKNLVIVGDNVWFQPTTADTGSIHHIIPRSSVLARSEHLHRIKQQLVAANVDQVLITVCLADPHVRPSMIDRYLIAAAKGRLSPVILINKIDLREEHPQEAQVVDECLRLYPSLGIKTIAFSALTGEGLDQVREVMKDKVSVFSGQSGTGKSFIINVLTGLSLKTGSIRAIGKGSHTTTSTRLLRLPFGGWCIDTPGIRSFGIFDLEKKDLQDEFSELFCQPCSFKNCWHIGEEGCAVPQAIDRGEISPLRFSSYISLLGSIDDPRKER